MSFDTWKDYKITVYRINHDTDIRKTTVKVRQRNDQAALEEALEHAYHNRIESGEWRKTDRLRHLAVISERKKVKKAMISL